MSELFVISLAELKEFATKHDLHVEVDHAERVASFQYDMRTFGAPLSGEEEL